MGPPGWHALLSSRKAPSCTWGWRNFVSVASLRHCKVEVTYSRRKSVSWLPAHVRTRCSTTPACQHKTSKLWWSWVPSRCCEQPSSQQQITITIHSSPTGRPLVAPLCRAHACILQPSQGGHQMLPMGARPHASKHELPAHRQLGPQINHSSLPHSSSSGCLPQPTVSSSYFVHASPPSARCNARQQMLPLHAPHQLHANA